ncbi:uncharacterized protein I206_101222 [Kwoniella pini CBS 10737]|uniref:Uncharacterized protein n=1 Tax=Kwoniella pini CBS 10737 TaxID=1296096 RepID=A0A1B9IAY8_9TREE|nr:uncharacterized protein I206_00101 [Kwoniella pini CBS 10737]OCF52805.1 hypothetical protein I206_00101 [Kwoniella pini CBS 10737]
MLTSPKGISHLHDNNENDKQPNSIKPESKSKSYSRSELISLAINDFSESQSERKLTKRLNSFTPILRFPSHSNSNKWIDELEGKSEFDLNLFDNLPISKDLPIPELTKNEKHPCDKSNISTSIEGEDENLFNYKSILKEENDFPILINFQNPFKFNQIENKIPLNSYEQQQKQIQHFEKDNLINSSNSNSINNLGIRIGSRENLSNNLIEIEKKLSRSNSNSTCSISSQTSSSKLSSSFSKDRNELNPFAPPFPIQNNLSNSNSKNNNNNILQPKPIQFNDKSITINKLRSNSPNNNNNNNNSPPSQNEISLPLPKLPSSLPLKPSPLPPIFIKKESAALPQPMSLPDIEPLGSNQWINENSLSGNEKRRRRKSINNSYNNSINNFSNKFNFENNSEPNSRRNSFNYNYNSNYNLEKEELTIRSRSNSPNTLVNRRSRNDSQTKQRW